MLSNELSQIILNLKKKLILPYLQGLLSIVFFVLIAYFIDSENSTYKSIDKMIQYILVSLSILAAIASIILPRWFFNYKRIDVLLKKDFGPGDWWDNTMVTKLIGNNKDKISKLSKNESKICAVLHWTFAYHYIFMIIPESVGLSGLLLSLLTQDYRYALVLCLISLPLMLNSYPRLHFIVQKIEMRIQG